MFNISWWRLHLGLFAKWIPSFLLGPSTCFAQRRLSPHYQQLWNYLLLTLQWCLWKFVYRWSNPIWGSYLARCQLIGKLHGFYQSWSSTKLFNDVSMFLLRSACVWKVLSEFHFSSIELDSINLHPAKPSRILSTYQRGVLLVLLHCLIRGHFLVLGFCHRHLSGLLKSHVRCQKCFRLSWSLLSPVH